MFKLKTSMVCFSLLVCFLTMVQGADRLIVCYAKGDHIAIEQVEHMAECGKPLATPVLSSFPPSTPMLSGSTDPIGCCGPCTDISFSVMSFVRLSACDELIKSLQTLPVDALSLWSEEAPAGIAAKPFLFEPLAIHDSIHNSIRSTVLLI
jgi:hypothetical protein